MKTKECPSCAMEIDEKADVCPICQYEFPKQSPLLKYVAIALAILLLIFWIIF
ncbi:hypothetical protein [Mangrovivirga cuniculi]|uniref:hypothetical protein n=1 Tax=Mangrovivirga cuniculi TaxID=2715131 RepID=UPI001585DD69|nr:hypothetical protein [Mangrovivirga cuniculi]